MNNPDYIDRTRLLNYISHLQHEDEDMFDIYQKFKKLILDLPSEKYVRKVNKASWEVCDYKYMDHGFIESIPNGGQVCSNCRVGFKIRSMTSDKYCPNCGSEMTWKEGSLKVVDGRFNI